MTKRIYGGFTLVELLVVISLIAVLASTVLVTINDARIKARDSKRLSDITQLRAALALYYNDNEKYPVVTELTNGWFEINSSQASWKNNTNSLAQALIPKYISSLPQDPINGPAGYLYGSTWLPPYPYTYLYATYDTGTPSAGREYDLAARFEKAYSWTCPNKQWPLYTYQDDNWCVYGFPASKRTMMADH